MVGFFFSPVRRRGLVGHATLAPQKGIGYFTLDFFALIRSIAFDSTNIRHRTLVLEAAVDARSEFQQAVVCNQAVPLDQVVQNALSFVSTGVRSSIRAGALSAQARIGDRTPPGALSLNVFHLEPPTLSTQIRRFRPTLLSIMFAAKDDESAGKSLLTPVVVSVWVVRPRTEKGPNRRSSVGFRSLGRLGISEGSSRPTVLQRDA
jgi:hypothetical protein